MKFKKYIAASMIALAGLTACIFGLREGLLC